METIGFKESPISLVFYVVGSNRVLPCEVSLSATIAEVKQMLAEKYGFIFKKLILFRALKGRSLFGGFSTSRQSKNR